MLSLTLFLLTHYHFNCKVYYFEKIFVLYVVVDILTQIYPTNNHKISLIILLCVVYHAGEMMFSYYKSCHAKLKTDRQLFRFIFDPFEYLA